MKKITILILTLIFSHKLCSQIVDARDDSFALRMDTFLDYNLLVKSNDTHSFAYKFRITNFYKTGTNAPNFILTLSPDSSYIHLKDNLKTNYIGEFVYFIKDSLGNSDSAIVKFTRININPSVYPGESNNDKLVNHLDIFALGLFYNKNGDARHNLDTNSIYTPKRISDWDLFVGSMNGKFADIDGNGVIDAKDFDKLKLNFGQTTGAYSPSLSDTTTTNSFSFNIADTVYLLSDTSKLIVPIKVSTANSSYGLGYSLLVQNQNQVTKIDTNYMNYKIQDQQVNPVWSNESAKSMLSINEKTTRPSHTNVAYVKTSGKPGPMTGEAGVVEVVVEDVLLGIKKVEDIGKIKIHVKDVVMIDENNNKIPLKPASKTIVLKKRFASIQSRNESIYQVYPTIVGNALIIEKSNLKSEQYSIYNSIGQQIQLGELKSSKTIIENINWTSGIYYLKLENSSQVIRLQKQ